MDYPDVPQVAEPGGELDEAETWPVARLRGEIEHLRADMLLAAEELRFEEAAGLRDRLNQLEDLELRR
jgi:excinuclease UvrABC nuclease subunit